MCALYTMKKSVILNIIFPLSGSMLVNKSSMFDVKESQMINDPTEKEEKFIIAFQ